METIIWTPAYLRHLDGLAPAAIHSELENTLFWAQGPAVVDPSHEDFCDFRAHLLANPRRIRAMYPNLAAELRVWLGLAYTKGLFLMSLRMHGCEATLRNLTVPAVPGVPVPAPPAFAIAWAPNAVVPADPVGKSAPPHPIDMVSGAIAAGCHDCLSALVDIGILPLDPANGHAAFNECGCSLILIAMLHYVWGHISEDECNKVIDVLTWTNGPGSQLWLRSYRTLAGIPAAAPIMTPLSAWYLLQHAVLLPTKSVERISEWHEDGALAIPDPNMIPAMAPSLLFSLADHASIHIAHWLRRHGVGLAGGYSIAPGPWPGRLAKNSWHALARNPAGAQLFDYFVSQAGTPFAALAFPNLRCMVTNETPMWDAIAADCPELVEKFANYHPPNVWVNYPNHLSEFLLALAKTNVESATCLHHIIGMPSFQAHFMSYMGTYNLAMEDLAHWVLDWYNWNYHILMSLAPLTTDGNRASLAELRRVATLKMTAVFHYVRLDWYGDV
ncbi:hypothetical protein N7507_007407 [Penicillium longicatenatum]|nr:hypothetical protein N7507_007407 [Penicillium longicatenatum]